MISIIQQSPIERYQPHERNFKKPYTETIAFSDEVIAYQIILYSSVDRGEDVSYEIKTSCHSRIYKADYVPVNWIHFESDDKEDYLIDSPGLLPDCLHPIKKEGKLHVCHSLTVLWVEFWFSGAGDKQHIIEFTDSYGKVYETCMNAHIINRGLSA